VIEVVTSSNNINQGDVLRII